jgi:hypothetical protein
MRAYLFLALIGLATASVASAEAPDARAAYAERRGLIEADTQCRLFTPDVRAALEVGAAQARGALLRSGWNNAQMRDLERAAVDASRARTCDDPRTESAAADARHAFTTWVNAGTMNFPGWERAWVARRSAGDRGWRLSQAIDAAASAVFGVREQDGAQRLTLVVQVQGSQSAPNTAMLVLRDATRARVTEISLTRRMSFGLQAGAPAPNVSATIPSTRTIERSSGHSQTVFLFPDTAFRDLLALDPRESVELRINTGRSTQTLYVEVGDIAAARAFLAIR